MLLTTILDLAGAVLLIASAVVLCVLAVLWWWPAALPVAGVTCLAVSWGITRAGAPRTWRKARL